MPLETSRQAGSSVGGLRCDALAPRLSTSPTAVDEDAVELAAVIDDDAHADFAVRQLAAA